MAIVMKKSSCIILLLSFTVLLNSTWFFCRVDSTKQYSAHQIVISANEAIQGVLQPLTLRYLLSLWDSTIVTSHQNSARLQFHSVRYYSAREHLPSDSPLKAFKYALGQYTSDY